MSADVPRRWCVWVLAGLAAAAAVGGCRKKTQAGLVLISPHNVNIQNEFERAFRVWHQQKYGTDVTFEWREVGGGTSSVTQFLINQYSSADSSGIDLYFGGGAPDHKLLATKGVTVPVKLPADIQAALPEKIGGVRQYDPDGHWYGAAVSCFGILYNAKLFQAEGLPAPKTWDDMASAELYGRIAAADASKSGSAKAAYEMIVQSAPSWREGWAKLLKIWGNCKTFTRGASDVVNAVANGDVFAGAAIDFYAFNQIALLGEEMGFTAVEGTTAFTPDPISMLKGAPHPETARRFIEFVLSPEGQALWCLPAGTPGGPKVHSLYRQPVRRDTYRTYQGKMLPALVDPFARAGDFQLDEKAAGARIGLLYAPLMKCAAKDSREQLHDAWKAVIDAGDTPRGKRLMAEFVSLPPELADEKTALATARKLADPDESMKLQNAWQRYFRDKYEKIIADRP